MTDLGLDTAQSTFRAPAEEEEWDERALRRSKWHAKATLYAVRFGLALLLLGGWEALSRWIIDPFWVSMPSQVASILYEWVTTGYVFYHLWATGQAMVGGLLLGSLVGISVGFILGRNHFLAQVMDPFITALYSMPRIALAPLFILWFGIDLQPKVMLASVIVFFLTFKNTFAGVRAVDPNLVNVVRIMGADRRVVLTKVVLPASLAWIFTGLRLAVPYSLVAAVVAEFVASSRGIGWIIRTASGVFDTTTVFAGLMVLMIVGFSLNQIIDWTERRSSRWRIGELG